MIDMAQADRTLRTPSTPFDRFAALLRLERENAQLIDALRSIACYDPTQWDAATLANIARRALSVAHKA